MPMPQWRSRSAECAERGGSPRTSRRECAMLWPTSCADLNARTTLMNDPVSPAVSPAAQLRHWYREGIRAALFLPPRWQGLQATPALLALFALAGLLLTVAVQR